MGLERRVVIVTGAASGICAAIARARAAGGVVHVAAARGAFGLGVSAVYGLGRIGRRAHLNDNSGSMRAMQVQAIGPADTLLMMTFDDDTPETVEVAVVRACGVTMEQGSPPPVWPFDHPCAGSHAHYRRNRRGNAAMNAAKNAAKNTIDIFFDLGVMERAIPILPHGLGNTLLLGAVAIVLGGLMELGIALPFAGIVLSSLAAAALSLAGSTPKLVRAGIQAVPKGQFPASAALGPGFWRMMPKDVQPQVMRRAIPPHASHGVSIIKDTSPGSVVAMTDLPKQATRAQALFANPTPLIGAALIYVAILWPLARRTGWPEHRFQRAHQR